MDLTYLCIMAPVEEALTSQNLLAPVYQLYPLGHSNKVQKYEKRSRKKQFKAKNDFKGIELDNKGRSIAILETPQTDINDKVHDDDEIELSRSEQWERLNELLLVITTILIFNVFSLLIAVFQVTLSDNGTVFNKKLILDSQESACPHLQTPSMQDSPSTLHVVKSTPPHGISIIRYYIFMI